MNIIDSKKIDDSGNQTNIRKFTPEEWHAEYLASRPVFSPAEEGALPENLQKKPSWFKQFLIFLERNIRTKLTNKQYLAITLLEAPLLALIVALLTRYMDGDEYTLLANKNFVSYIFMSVIVSTFMGLSISAEEIIKDRTILKREHFLRLSRSSYLTSKMVYLLAVSGLQSLLFIGVGNTIIGVGSEMFGTWWSILWATSFLANLTGLILSQTMSSVVAIYITIPLLLIPQILLCGLVIKFDDLNTRASDENIVPLIGEVIPSRWAFEALMVEQFRDNAYNRPYFPIEKEKFLAQYYENVHLPEVRSLAEQIAVKDDPDKRKTVENELAVLSRAARIAPRTENESYLAYLDKVDAALHERAHNFTAYLDQIQQERGREEGAKPAALPEFGRVDTSWFADAAFLGDSLTAGFCANEYNIDVGGALICGYEGISPNTVVNRTTVTSPDRGEEVPLDVLAAAQPAKLYILIGTNALVQPGNDDSFLAYYGKMLDDLRTALPDTTFYVQSVLTATQEKVSDSLPGLAPDRLAAINAAIQQLCAERGCYYLDLNAEFADDAGYLQTDFSQPDGVHLTVSGYSKWVSYLCTHVPYSKNNPYQAGSTYYLSDDMKNLLNDIP